MEFEVCFGILEISTNLFIIFCWSAFLYHKSIVSVSLTMGFKEMSGGFEVLQWINIIMQTPHAFPL